MKKQRLIGSALLVRIFCILMAFHFFNLSMDSKDSQPDFEPEDLSMNDIESITEFVTEVMLGVDNVFAEHDEQDDISGSGSLSAKAFICPAGQNHMLATASDCKVHYYIYNAALLPSSVSDIKVPPPQA